MLPIIVDLGFIKIYTFGIFLVLSFFWSSFFLWKNIALTSFKEEDIFDALFLSIFGGFLVGRGVHIFLNFDDFKFDILKYILINGYPGIHATGAVVGFFIFLLIYTKINKFHFSKLIDYVVPALLLAVAICKLGAFFSGSEVGAQTSFILSLKYPNLDGLRHLTPLYESFFYFLGSSISYRILMDIRREKYYEGFNFLAFWVIYSLSMVLSDPLKSFKIIWQGYSMNLIIHGIILLTGSICILYYFRTSLLKVLTRKQK